MKSGWRERVEGFASVDFPGCGVSRAVHGRNYFLSFHGI